MRNLFQWTCWCLLVVFPMSLYAADVENVAMLSGSGTVQINGASSPNTSTVFVGDKVATAKDSTVVLSSKGRTIILPENSSVTYGGKRVRLEYGQAFINAQPGTEAQLADLTITPAQADAKLEMMKSSGNKMVLVARAGSFNVTDGRHSLVLESGQALMSDDPQDQGGAPQSTTPTPTYKNRVCGFLSGDSQKRIPCGWWLVIGAAGVTVVALAAAGKFSSSSTPSTALSPAKP